MRTLTATTLAVIASLALVRPFEHAAFGKHLLGARRRRLLTLAICAVAAPLLFGTATATAQTFDDPSGDVLGCSGECASRDQDLRSVKVESSGGQASFTIEQYGPFTDPMSCRCFYPQLYLYIGSTTLAKPDYYTAAWTGTFPYPIALFDRSLTQTGIGVNNCPIPSGFNGVGIVGGDPLTVVNDRTITYTFDLTSIGNPGSFEWRVGEPAASTCQTQGNPEPNPRDVVPDSGVASFGGGSGGGGGVAATVTAPRSADLNGNKVVIPVDVAADEDLTANASGKVKINPTYKLKPKSAQLAAGQTKTLKLKPKQKAQAKKIAKALKQGEKATAKVTVKLTDGEGGTESEKVKVKLKR